MGAISGAATEAVILPAGDGVDQGQLAAGDLGPNESPRRRKS